MIESISQLNNQIAEQFDPVLERLSESSGMPKYVFPIAATATVLIITCLWQRRTSPRVPNNSQGAPKPMVLEREELPAKSFQAQGLVERSQDDLLTDESLQESVQKSEAEEEGPKFVFTIEKLVKTDEEGRLPIHLAARDGDLEAIRILQENGANLDSPDKEGNTPLQYAAQTGNIEAIRLLRQFGANPNLSNNIGRTPIFAVVEKGNIEAFETLKQLQAILDWKDLEEQSLLDIAYKNWNIDMIVALVNSGLSASSQLYRAYQEDEAIMIERLKELEVGLVAYRNTLHTAVEQNALGEIGRLVKATCIEKEKEALLEGLDKEGRTPVRLAITLENLTAVLILKELGAKVYSKPNFTNPLHVAVATDDLEMLDISVRWGLDVNVTNSHGDAPMHIAARKGNVKLVRKLVDLGADIHCMTKGPDTRMFGGLTPLHVAVQARQSEVVEVLLQLGADLNRGMKTEHGLGVEPIFFARDKELFQKLVGLGANLDTVDPIQGMTILHAAVMIDDEEILKQLVEKGFDIDAEAKIYERNDNKELVLSEKTVTPLGMAVKTNSSVAADYLRGLGAKE